MNRRRFFSALPLGLLGLPSALIAEPETPTEPSAWVEFDCEEVVRWYGDAPDWPVIKEIPCGTRFKVLRGTSPYCPKCGCLVGYGPHNREKFEGIEVKK